MKMIFRLVCVCSALLGLVQLTSASSIQLLSPSAAIDSSAAVFRGTVQRFSCFKDTNGLIFTCTTIQVSEPLKGTFASTIQLMHRGGQIGNDDDYCGLSPRLATGEEYLFFVHRRPDGQLECTQGSASAVKLIHPAGSTSYASPGGDLLTTVRQLTNNGKTPGGDDVTDQAAGHVAEALTGMLGGVASRFLQPDRGEPIPYLIDAASLPAGMTLTQATNAVQQALNAWTAVTSLKFQLEAIQSFGQGADTITASDGKLRIQLHDNYNRITTANTLGVGGRNAYTVTIPGLTWGVGGNVAGNEFNLSTRGYVVLEAANPTMQNPVTLAEVLCHEIGHALCLAHSSESTNEPNSTLKQAIMYFQAHADGRGATLGSYDTSTIQQIYPANTPPYIDQYNRVMDVTTQPSGAPNVPGINEVSVRGGDLQTTPSLILDNFFGSGGSFSATGSLVKFTPAGYYNGPRLDPATADTSVYAQIYARYSDGVNASPYVFVSVISLNPDQYPSSSAADGMPNAWMTTYFGSANPVGGKRAAGDDYDGDGMSNLDEYRAGMDPTVAASAQRITLVNKTNIQWQAKAYELYEVLGSTNLSTWTRVGNPVLPTTSTGSLTISPSNSYRFFKILKVP